MANVKNENGKNGVKIVNGGDVKPIKPISTLLTPNDLAKQFSTDSKKIRVILRKHKIQKNDDGKYGWSKTEYDKIVKTVKMEMDKPIEPPIAK